MEMGQWKQEEKGSESQEIRDSSGDVLGHKLVMKSQASIYYFTL